MISIIFSVVLGVGGISSAVLFFYVKRKREENYDYEPINSTV